MTRSGGEFLPRFAPRTPTELTINGIGERGHGARGIAVVLRVRQAPSRDTNLHLTNCMHEPTAVEITGVAVAPIIRCRSERVLTSGSIRTASSRIPHVQLIPEEVAFPTAIGVGNIGRMRCARR